MTPDRIIESLRAVGVTAERDGAELRLRGPQKALTPALLSEVREYKAELIAALERRELSALADSIAERMLRLHEVPPEEWESEKRALLADDDRLAAGMRRLGVGLEELGWSVGNGCRWRRVKG